MVAASSPAAPPAAPSPPPSEPGENQSSFGLVRGYRSWFDGPVANSGSNDEQKSDQSESGLLPNALNPLKLAGAAFGLGFKVAGWTERQAMRILRDRLDAATSGPLALPASPTSNESAPEAPPAATLDAKLQSLLHRAVEQSTAGGRTELFHKILDQLVPDEARILGALADGSSSPLVNIYGRSRSGGDGSAVLANASLVGRTAHLALPRLTDTYVTHLLVLRLVEIGPEDESKGSDYEILMAETFVLDALKKASWGPLPARVERQTLRLSELGRSLWDAAQAGNK